MMNATGVSKNAGRRSGIPLTLLLFAGITDAADVSRIYVLSADRGCKVSTYTPDGKPIDPRIQIGGFGCTAIAVDASGKILVSIRAQKGQLMRFEPDGKPTTPLLKGVNAGGIVFDPSGNIHLLIAQNTTTSFVREFTAEGSPTDKSIKISMDNVSGFAIDRDGKILAISQGYGVLKSFDASGQPAMPIIRAGLEIPRAIVIGPDDKIHVANFLTVTTYLPNGQRVEPTLRHKNPATDGLDTAVALAVDAKGKLYVGYYSGWVGIINPDGKPSGPAFMAHDEIRGIAVH